MPEIIRVIDVVAEQIFRLFSGRGGLPVVEDVRIRALNFLCDLSSGRRVILHMV